MKNQIELLREQVANSKRVLALPNTRYPNGHMSHDVHGELLLKAQDELEDALLAAPKYADGTLAI